MTTPNPAAVDGVATTGRRTVPGADARLSADVLVAGGGLAGIAAALAARSRGCDVLLVGRGKRGTASDTAIASGGLAISVNKPAGDAPTLHAEDTLTGGYGLAEDYVVKAVTDDAPGTLRRLLDYGAKVARTAEGSVDFRPIPGHSKPRSVRSAGGGTANLVSPLVARLDEVGVRCHEGIFVNRIVTSGTGADKRAAGVHAIEEASGRRLAVTAGAVVLATGGLGHLYAHTSNDPAINGSSCALALRAGCGVADVEFVQFTPTALIYPDFAIGMSPGGALMAHPGVALRNADGERFMWRYDPEHGECTTRDTLSRAIFREVAEGRGTVHGGVYLDLSGTTRDAISDISGRFLRAMDSAGWDPFVDMVELAPEAHFAMGGVVVDETTATELPGMFAAGEAACGMHGANRLNSNALTEAATTGHRAGTAAADFVMRSGRPADSLPAAADATARPTAGPDDVTSLERIGRRLRELMSTHVGVERNAAGLADALSELADLRAALPPTDHLATVSLEHRLLAAEAVIRAALLRCESRGAHFRTDYPEPCGIERTHIVTILDDAGELRHTRVDPGHLKDRVTSQPA